MKTWKPRIRKTIIAGAVYHQADWSEGGKRHRKTLRDQAELEDFITTKRDELNAVDELRRVEGKNHAVVRLSHLAPADRAATAQALEIITAAGGRPAHLVEAARNYARSYLAHAGAKPVKDALADFIEAKERSNKRGRTITGYRSLLTPFAEHFKDRSVHAMTMQEIEGYMRTAAPSASTWNHLRVAVIGLFNHAVARGWAEKNPAAQLDTIAEDRGLPAVFSPAEVRRLLAAAAKVEPRMVPYYAIGTFAGLRPENELRNLSWDNVHLSEGFIRVDAATAKTRRHRDVELSGNALAWLQAHAQAEGPLYYSRRKHREIVEAAKLSWSKDIMRHSYGSYLLAQIEDEAKVASRMGNSVGIIHAHYKNLRTKAEAVEFWALAPAENKVVRFPKRAATGGA